MTIFIRELRINVFKWHFLIDLRSCKYRSILSEII